MAIAKPETFAAGPPLDDGALTAFADSARSHSGALPTPRFPTGSFGCLRGSAVSLESTGR